MPKLTAKESPKRLERAYRLLYFEHLTHKAVANDIGVAERTIRAWIKKNGWAEAKTTKPPVSYLAHNRVGELLGRENKTDLEVRELKILLDFVKSPKSNNEVGLSRSAASSTMRKKVNNVDHLEFEDLKKIIYPSLLKYQKHWWDVRFGNESPKSRFILKSRKIGATWYFAREALAAAIGLGANQNFISASKRQSQLFREFIVEFAKDKLDLRLRGKDEIRLSNGAVLYFLSTNSATVQGNEGDVYFDETFWIPKFAELEPLASGIATHRQFKITYFSTPSTKSHDAYDLWSGKLRRLPEEEAFKVTHSALKKGRLCEDDIWRQVVNINDACEQGADAFFDLQDLRRRNPGSKFDNLYLCKFLDASLSVFDFSKLNACLVDASVEWDDVDLASERPCGNEPVWLGMDPSGGGDNSSIAAVLPPLISGGAFRIVEVVNVNAKTYSSQAGEVRSLLNKYNVQEVIIDTTGGHGCGVLEHVRVFFPQAQSVVYSLHTKTQMVEKTLDVINSGRLKFDAGERDIIQNFLMVKPKTTATGKATYYADRSDKHSHADIAWAIMHALMLEPFNPEAPGASYHIN